MKYELLWTSSKDKAVYSSYAKNKRDLKEKLDYFVNVKGLKLNDEDILDNIQVSKRIAKIGWLILTSKEVIEEII